MLFAGFGRENLLGCDCFVMIVRHKRHHTSLTERDVLTLRRQKVGLKAIPRNLLESAYTFLSAQVLSISWLTMHGSPAVILVKSISDTGDHG